MRKWELPDRQGSDHPRVALSGPVPSSQYFAGTRNMKSLLNS